MIYLLQLLCPARHCIVAMMFEGIKPDEAIKLASANFDKMISEHGLNRRCGICGSEKLKWECGKTKFKTQKEAVQCLGEEQLKQMLTRAVLEEQGKTFDSQERLKNN